MQKKMRTYVSWLSATEISTAREMQSLYVAVKERQAVGQYRVKTERKTAKMSITIDIKSNMQLPPLSLSEDEVECFLHYMDSLFDLGVVGQAAVDELLLGI